MNISGREKREERMKTKSLGEEGRPSLSGKWVCDFQFRKKRGPPYHRT